MRPAPLLALLVLMCGCGDDRADNDYWLDGQKRQPRAEDAPVEIFITAKPTRPHREIALLHFKTEGDGRKQTATLKRFTRARGGDGVIVQGAGAAHNDPNLIGYDKSHTFTDAVVIEYTDGR